MTDTKLVNFVCPIELLEVFDKAWNGKYNTRTDALLDLMRKFVENKRKKEASQLPKKRKKYERLEFDLEECKASINIIEKESEKGYGTAYLNITLPDGRWVSFKMPDCYRVPLYKKEASK